MSSANLWRDRPGDERHSSAPKSSLANRLAGFFFIASIVLVSLASGILYYATVAALREADDQVIEKRMQDVRALLQSKVIDQSALAHEISEDKQGPRQILIRVQSTLLPQFETPSMDRKLSPRLFPNAVQLPPNTTINTTIVSETGQTYRALTVRVPLDGSGDTTIQVATDTTLDEAGLAVFRRILMWVLGFAIPLCALASWLIVRRELEPLKRITAAVRHIDSSTLGERLAVDGLPLELNVLGSHFNDMLTRLETASNSLKQYADNLAHELRTPLNRMRLQSELALRHAKTVEDYQTAMASTVEECEALTQLLHGLLFLARATSNQTVITRVPIQLSCIISRVREFYAVPASEAGVAFKCETDVDCDLYADRELLQRAISNLVSNALAHTPRGGTVTVSAAKQIDTVSISVCDTGEGIALQHQEYLFERYYRAAHKPAHQNGLGLGLSIAKSVVELHGGTISFTSTEGKGTKFVICLPLTVS